LEQNQLAMITRYPLLYQLLWLAALLAVLGGLVFPVWLEQAEYPLALAFMLLVGLPHGATDHLLFGQLSREQGRKISMPLFYVFYVGLVLAYGVLWILLPWPALLLFLLVSVYHFGQSNWNYLAPRAWSVHLSWGAFVLFVPVVWHFEASRAVISVMVKQEVPQIPDTVRHVTVVCLLVLNQGLIIWNVVRKNLGKWSGFLESVNLWILFAMFLALPLMLGFALYFAGWHALSSSMDQISFFRKERKSFGWKDYIRAAAPYTLLALASLAGLYLLWPFMGQGVLHPGLLFMFIAAVTLPHMLLIDQLYGRNKEDSGGLA
jgi:Brp/Blh family beta-carotene 15,15'-monooxygenase